MFLSSSIFSLINFFIHLIISSCHQYAIARMKFIFVQCFVSSIDFSINSLISTGNKSRSQTVLKLIQFLIKFLIIFGILFLISQNKCSSSSVHLFSRFFFAIIHILTVSISSLRHRLTIFSTLSTQ